MSKYLTIARKAVAPAAGAATQANYRALADLTPEVATRGLAVQAQLDAAFDALPAPLQDISAIEAAPFWVADGDEMKRLQDAWDWPGLLAALDRHLEHGLAMYGRLREDGATHG